MTLPSSPKTTRKRKTAIDKKEAANLQFEELVGASGLELPRSWTVTGREDKFLFRAPLDR
jgi:hypothetical protein